MKRCPFCAGAGWRWFAPIVNGVKQVIVGGQVIKCRWCAGTGNAQRTLAEVAQ